MYGVKHWERRRKIELCKFTSPQKKKKNGLWKEKMKETESSGRGNLLGEIGCIVEEWFEK